MVRYAWFLASLLALGCGGAGLEALRSRAAYDFGCKSERMKLKKLDRRTYGVSGCGRRSTYVHTCGPGGGCTWVLNSDSTPVEAEDTSSRRWRAPIVNVQTIATQQDGARTVKLESAGSHPDKTLRFTTTSDKRALADCKEVAITSGDNRTALPAKYRVKLYDGKIFETLEARVTNDALRFITTSNEATFEACGQALALNAAFLAAARAAVPAPAGAAPPPATTLRARLALEPVVFVVQTDPSAADQAIWLGALTKVRPTDGTARCPIKLVRDGEPVELGELEHKSTAQGEEYRVKIAQELLEQLSSAQRVVGKVCEQRFQLEDAHLAELKSLVLKIREERALAQ